MDKLLRSLKRERERELERGRETETQREREREREIPFSYGKHVPQTLAMKTVNGCFPFYLQPAPAAKVVEFRKLGKPKYMGHSLKLGTIL